MNRTIEVRLETLVARPPEEVWAFVSDFEHLPDWLDEFRSVIKESDGPPAEGSVFCYTLEPGNRSGTLRLAEWVPGERLAWDGPPLGWRVGAARPSGYFEVARAGEGATRFISCYRPELQGAMVLLAPVMKRWLRRQRTIDSDRLKALLERTRSERPPE
jgi:uncharacterized protein YndB with AHSA1/START domain